VLATAIATALIFLRGNMELEWRRPGVDWSFTFPLTVDDVGACREQFRDLSPTCLKPLPSTTFCLESKRYTNALFPRNDTVKFLFRFWTWAYKDWNRANDQANLSSWLHCTYMYHQHAEPAPLPLPGVEIVLATETCDDHSQSTPRALKVSLLRINHGYEHTQTGRVSAALWLCDVGRLICWALKQIGASWTPQPCPQELALTYHRTYTVFRYWQSFGIDVPEPQNVGRWQVLRCLRIRRDPETRPEYVFWKAPGR